MTISRVVTDAVSPEMAVGYLLGVTGLALVVAALVVVFAVGQHRVIRRTGRDMADANDALADAGRALAKANANLVQATAWGSRLADENTRLRATRPMPQPTADTAVLPTRTVRHGDAT